MSKLSTLMRRTFGSKAPTQTNGVAPKRLLNKILLSAYSLRKLRPTSGAIELSIVTDQPATYSADECRQTLAPWSRWLNVARHEFWVGPPDAQAFERLGLNRGHVLIPLVNDPASEVAWQSICERFGVRCIVPQLPPARTLDHDFIREVSHFDTELGGRNQPDGSAPQFSKETLRQLSSTNCREYYPAFATRALLNSLESPSRRLTALDVGCGPISVLRWGAIQGELSITGVDPLLDMYALVLARHGFDSLPKIRCDREVVGFGEELDTLLPNDRFDLVYTQNSLDHTQQPQRVIEQIGRRLAPCGIAVLQVATREGTRRKWDQLHKTDIYMNNGELVFAHQHTREQPLLSLESGLRLKHVECYTPDWLACVLERK